jgi:nitrite reductase/ring-hydroxylating ferredoxin subunit
VVADLRRPGSRKLVTAFGRSALLFWYRDKVYAVEPRSPASGAYSEGLETARFTQDGCIECPQTQTTFDLATGAIKSWYPTNPVLRMLTPQEVAGRPLEVFPVRTDASTISVAFDSSNLAALGLEGTSAAPTTSGGVETSAERNNVYGIEPRVYLQDGSDDPDQGTGARPGAKPAVIITGTLAVGIIAVAGTAVAISKESIPGLVIFWIALLVPVVYFIVKNAGEGGEDGK